MYVKVEFVYMKQKIMAQVEEHFLCQEKSLTIAFCSAMQQHKNHIFYHTLYGGWWLYCAMRT